MRWIFALLFLLTYGHVNSEGTKELAPNANIIVEGISTPDVAALLIGHHFYGKFAEFNQNGAERLQIRILDPANESLMLGFGIGRYNEPFIDKNNIPTQFRFYVKDPNGEIVYQSQIINEDNAPIKTWNQAVAGPQGIVGPSGYNQINISSTDLMSQGWDGEGDYYVEFEHIASDEPLLIQFWDISVINCTGGPCNARKGRVWSEKWALFSTAVSQTSSIYKRPFNGSFFIVAPDELNPGAGFVTKMNFDGSEFRAAAFTVALNSFGASRSGSLQMNRKSVFSDNTITGEYPVFLNDPEDIYQTAEFGSLRILGTEGCAPDNFCIKAVSSVTGEIEILFDLDGSDKLYSPNSADVLINYRVEVVDVNQEICIPWDGRDGLGAIYQDMDSDSITIITSLGQGIYHFPIFDAENNHNGFRLESVRPLAKDPVMYYDDSAIPFSSLTMSPNVDLQGCTTPCHTWKGEFFGLSYGNNNTINSWWYAQTIKNEQKILLNRNISLTTDLSFCEGSFVEVGDSIIASEGDYQFMYSTTTGCDSVVNVVVHRIDLQSEIIAESNFLNCYNPEIELRTTLLNPTDDILFLWSVPAGQEISDLNRPTLLINTPGKYMVTISEKTNGCDHISEFEIFGDLREPIISIDKEKSFSCYEEERQLNASVDNVDDFNVVWTTDDGNFLTGMDGLQPTINQAGKYVLYAQNIVNGCSSTFELNILLDTFTYLTIDGLSHQNAPFCKTVNMTVDVSSAAFDSIRWFPAADLSCADCLSPELFVTRDEVFQVVVTDTNGCVAIKSIEVLVNEDFKLYIPNAFSPNNDGINDELKIYSAPCEVDIVSFSVFDRWGNKIFERSDFKSAADDMGWDGFYQDKLMDVGVYVYQASIRTFRNEIVQLSGDVQLTR